MSTRITHTDPKAEYGALAARVAARLASRAEPVSCEEYVHLLRQALHNECADELLELLDRMTVSLSEGRSTIAFADSLGLHSGVSGYMYHTVPVVLHAWLRHQRDFPAAAAEVIRCGGDADSTAAIVGGIVGAAVGKEGIPAAWLDRLWEWPRTSAWMERLATQLYESRMQGAKGRPPRLPIYGVLPRNLFFLGVVLAHGLRRLLPPY